MDAMGIKDSSGAPMMKSDGTPYTLKEYVVNNANRRAIGGRNQKQMAAVLNFTGNSMGIEAGSNMTKHIESTRNNVKYEGHLDTTGTLVERATRLKAEMTSTSPRSVRRLNELKNEWKELSAAGDATVNTMLDNMARNDLNFTKEQFETAVALEVFNNRDNLGDEELDKSEKSEMLSESLQRIVEVHQGIVRDKVSSVMTTRAEMDDVYRDFGRIVARGDKIDIERDYYDMLDEELLDEDEGEVEKVIDRSSLGKIGYVRHDGMTREEERDNKEYRKRKKELEKTKTRQTVEEAQANYEGSIRESIAAVLSIGTGTGEAAAGIAAAAVNTGATGNMSLQNMLAPADLVTEGIQKVGQNISGTYSASANKNSRGGTRSASRAAKNNEQYGLSDGEVSKELRDIQIEHDVSARKANAIESRLYRK